jgi:transcriptional regulator with XRE-family HTH domain
MRLNLHPILTRTGINQTTLADRVGVRKGFISEIISGKKTPSYDTLIAMAAALGVQVGELFEDAPTKPAPAAGLSESQAVPYAWQPRNQPEAHGDEIAALSSALRRPETYQVTSAVPWLALLAGDVLVVDLGTAPRDGDLILVGVIDSDSGTTRTILARFQNGQALTPDPTQPEPVLNLDTDPRAAWRATVKSVVRQMVL